MRPVSVGSLHTGLGWGKKCRRFPFQNQLLSSKSPGRHCQHSLFPTPAPSLLALCQEGESQNWATSTGGFQTFGTVTHSQTPVPSRGLQKSPAQRGQDLPENMALSLFCLLKKMLLGSSFTPSHRPRTQAWEEASLPGSHGDTAPMLGLEPGLLSPAAPRGCSAERGGLAQHSGARGREQWVMRRRSPDGAILKEELSPRLDTQQLAQRGLT